MSGHRLKVSPINWEAYEAKRGRPISEDERRLLSCVNSLTEALRMIVHLREEFLLGCLEGKNPKAVRRLGRRTLRTAETVRVLMMLETMDPDFWQYLEGELR